eukprot:2607419-Pyramimonas_sp.AAC.1
MESLGNVPVGLAEIAGGSNARAQLLRDGERDDPDERLLGSGRLSSLKRPKFTSLSPSRSPLPSYLFLSF